MSFIGNSIENKSVGVQPPYYEVVSNTLVGHGDNLTLLCTKSTTLSQVDFSSATVRRVGPHAFEATMISSITFPSGLHSIDNNAFYSCTRLSSINLPTTLVSIGKSVFSRCSALSSLQIPEGVTTIGNTCFTDCTSLESLSFPTTLRSFDGGFSGLTHLSLIDVSMTKITTIPTYFITMTCTGIQEIKFPSTVTQMKNNPGFGYCANLTKLTFLSPTPFSLPSSSTIPSQVTNIYVPAASVDAYKTATNWSNYASKISAVPT